MTASERQISRLVTISSTDPLPFDGAAARAYGRIYAAVVASGRKARGARAVDLLIAAIALANGLPLYTYNVTDFEAIGDLIDIVLPTALVE